jgi:DNA mismatch repair ATPase MutS
MNSGKLDQELSRLNMIINNVTGNSLLLMNESFATTTEREGARIAKDIILALYEKRIKTIFVTHLFEFANDLYGRSLENVFFLRAERQDKGERTFRIIPGKPLRTSYGEDLYNAIIEDDSSNERLA